MHFDQAVEQFLFHCRYEKNLTDKTIKAYALDLGQFKAKLKDDSSDVSKIDKQTIRIFLKILFDNYKPRSIKRKIATLKAFFSYLEFEDIIPNTPFRKLRIKIDREKELPKTLSLDSVQKIIQAAYDEKKIYPEESMNQKKVCKDIAILEILFATGMRVSEVCELKYENVDLETGFLKVRGKGRKERIISLCEEVTSGPLKDYRKSITSLHHSGSPFFINDSGTPVTDQYIRAMLRKYTQKANIKIHVTPHMFRHTIATLLLENGVDIRNIQYFLGHSSISVTEIYTKVNGKRQRDMLQERHPRKMFQRGD